MPLNFGEDDGRLRGAWLATFSASGVQYQLLRSPARRFVNLDNGDGFTAAEVDQAFVKLRIRGNASDVRETDVDLAKEALGALGAYRVFVELHVERQARARDTSVDDTLGEAEAFARWMGSQNGAVPAELAARVVERAQGYFERVLA
jgi:hypothetical protein